MERSFKRVETGGRNPHWLGANFWSRTGGPLMWSNYDEHVVEGELSVLRAHGINTTRSFFYWPEFMPYPEQIDGDLVMIFRTFLDQHSQAGLETIPTFIVGHMSGENWDPAWRRGRDLYRDVWMVSRQAWFIREMARQFGGHPAVAGWLITNEMPLYGGSAPEEVVTAWAELMIDALRAGGATQPVSIGDGAWGVTGSANGFNVHGLASKTGWVGPHVYSWEADPVRQHLLAAFVCELAGLAAAPVVLEEFGVSSALTSGAHSGHYYRQTLHNTLLAGATGWLAWNNTDYDHLVDQRPYSHHPFEMYFGITTSAGEPKAPLLEIGAFAKMLETVDIGGCARLPADVVLVVPAFLDEDVPFVEDGDRGCAYKSLLQAYIAAREADIALGFEHERHGIASGYRLYLVVAGKHLNASSWYRLEALAQEGATVYVSYSPGATPVQSGPWHPHFDAMFGVEHQLPYSGGQAIPRERVQVRFAGDLGCLGAGDELELLVGGTPLERTFIPVEARSAEVIATDDEGWPVLVRRQAGEGQIVLCTYAVEQMAAAVHVANPEPTWQLYDALATVAGVRRLVTAGDPRVCIDGLQHQDGSVWIWFVSQCPLELTVTPDVHSEGSMLTEPESDEKVTTFTLPPWGVRVLRLSSVG